MGQLRYLWTLTFAGAGVHDYDQAKRLASGFLRSRKGRVALGSVWCLVAELHPGGHGWHFHVAIPDRRLVGLVRQFWSEWLAGQGQPAPATRDGLVNVLVKDFGSSDRVAGYLSKYMTKSEDVPFGRHRYEFSHDVSVQPVAVGRLVAVSTVEVLRELIRQGVPVAGAHVLEWGQLYDWGKGPPEKWEGPTMVAARW